MKRVNKHGQCEEEHGGLNNKCVLKVTTKVSRLSSNGSKLSIKISKPGMDTSRKDMEGWKQRMETWVNNMDVSKLERLDWSEPEALEKGFYVTDSDIPGSEAHVSGTRAR